MPAHRSCLIVSGIRDSMPYPGHKGAIMSVRERTARYKSSGGAAGLIRVEVLVPPEGRARILDLAARIRAEHRGKASPRPELSALFDEAVTRYGARCLWNIRPRKTPEGMMVIANKLRQHGDMNAWKLASRIKEELSNAS